MTDKRAWYREPETFIALAALIVSISAMVVGIYEAALQRAHDRAEVWPHVELATFTNPQGAIVTLENGGLGPAVIKSVVVTVDGKRRRNWAEVWQALNGAASASYGVRTIVDHSLRAGEQVTLVSVDNKDLPKDFWPTVARVGVTVCYASVFGENWQLSSHLGGTDVWQSVDECPAQPPGSEF